MSFLLKKDKVYVKIKVGDSMNEEIKKIPPKNYILVVIISTLTILILGYFTFWYKNNQEYYNNNSIMSGYLSEVQEEGIIDNLTNYVMDNPKCLLYVSFGNDASIKDFEYEFKNLIGKHNINSYFIYVDLNLVTDKKFISNVQQNFFSDELKNKNINLERQSNIFVFENGKIVDILYSSKQIINLNDVQRLLIKHEVIEND